MVDGQRKNKYTRPALCSANPSYWLLVGVNYSANGHCISCHLSVRRHIWPFLECHRRGTPTQRGMGHVLHSEQFLEQDMAPEFPQSIEDPEPLCCETRRMRSPKIMGESSDPVPHRFCHLWDLPLGSRKDCHSIREFHKNASFLCDHANDYVIRRPCYLHRSRTAWLAESTMACRRIHMDLFRPDFA